MGLTQSTAASQCAAYLTGDVPASALKAYVVIYLNSRASVLGFATPPDSASASQPRPRPSPSPAPNAPATIEPTNNLTVKFPSVNLRARIAGMGASFGPIMAASLAIKAALEAEANNFVLPSLGGIAAVDPTSPQWNWLLATNSAGAAVPNPLVFPLAVPGTPGAFQLPGAVFAGNTGATPPAGVPANTAYCVTITADPTTGLGSVAYTLGGTIVSGAVSGGTAWVGPDPM